MTVSSLFSLQNMLATGWKEQADRGQEHLVRPIGIVDIGSNSVRLVVYDGAVRAPTPLFNEKVLCGLGRSVATTGAMGREAIARTVAALTRFRGITRTLRVGYLKAVATAAAREASDGPEFVALAEAALGTSIEILSGEREAELAAYGILMGFTEPDGMAGDLGGGSLELIEIKRGALTSATSLPLGVLRMQELSQGKRKKAAEIADKALSDVTWTKKLAPKRFFAVGGSWRALAKLHMAQSNYPLHVMHHYTIDTGTTLKFLDEICRSGDPSTIPSIDAISKARRDTLIYGATVLERTLRRVRPKSVVFSVFGIREGLIYDLLPEAERAVDPLIRFCQTYAELRSRGGMAHGYELFRWMQPVFDAYQGGETDEQRRLRLAACLLSDIGWRAHPDYRGEQSLNVIAHAALTGIDHPGRLFLALTIYFRHRGPSLSADALSEQLTTMAGPAQLDRAKLVAAAVRSAHVLSCGMPGVIDETPLSVDDKVLTLRLSAPYAALNGERVQRRGEALANGIGRAFEVVVDTDD